MSLQSAAKLVGPTVPGPSAPDDGHSGQVRTYRHADPTSSRIAPAALIIAGLVATALAATILIAGYADDVRRQAVERWQSRLDLIVATRTDALRSWLDRQVRDIAAIAANPSVQLYLSERRAVPAGAVSAEGAAIRRAQDGYLRNMLEVSAQRLGFTGPVLGPAVRANVARTGVAGLALVDLQGRRLAASATMPAIDLPLGAFLRRAARGRPAVRDIYAGPDGAPAMAFAAPVFAVQGGTSAQAQLGWIVGVRPVSAALAQALVQPGESAASAGAMLVRLEGAAVRYLWPPQGSDRGIGPTRPFATPGLAASFAIAEPGGFAIRRDAANTEVLVAARRIERLGWTVAYSVDRSEAPGPAEARQKRLVVIALLALLAVGAAFLAVWRHGASRRARASAERYALLSDRFAAQSRFLGLVNDAQPGPMFILDPQGVYTFANRAAGEAAAMVPADMIGKTVLAIRGTVQGQRSIALLNEARTQGKAIARLQRDEGASGIERIVQTQYIPLAANLGLGERVLVVEHDITAEVAERERRERIQVSTVDTLLAILDRRDPYAAEHSARVARLSERIAAEMGIDAAERETAMVAAKLMNVGKVLVSSRVMASDAPLPEAELRLIRDSIAATAELLEPIEFDGPVVDTLGQMQARYDGTEPPGAPAGADILRPARIIAVANAFVAMTSKRAYRNAADIDEAVQTLMGEAGKAYDRAVVAALVSHLENHGGRAEMSAATIRAV